MGAAQSIIDDPHAQFRVRFTRSRGFAALFELPENTYQWSGYGTLRVERHGIQFEASRRRVMGLPRAEARFVAGREISNVYREGDGVRVEFRDDAQQNVLNFWAENSAAAASIVEQLPTVRTVEVEEAPRRTVRPAKRAIRLDLLVMLIAAVLVLAAVAWLAMRVMAYASMPADSLPAVRPPSSVVAQPSAPGVSADDLKIMQQDFARFTARSEALRLQFDSAFRSLLNGNLSQENFAGRLEYRFIPQWVSAEKELRKTPQPPGSPREAFRAALIGVTSNWRSGLEAYVAGLRAADSEQVLRAFTYIGAAEASQREAQELLDTR
jgi:hypothetical protein